MLFTVQVIVLAVTSALGTFAHAAATQVELAPYRCLNKQGDIGRGTGRMSREGEYSQFLKRPVRAGEFVIFRYSGTGKEYWFKSSNCSRE